MKLLFALLTAAALSAGCSSPNASAMNDLRVGMNRSAVVSELGQPETTSAAGSSEVLTYHLKSRRDGSPGEYFVKLVDGRVTAFGLKSDYEKLLDTPGPK